MKFKLPKLFKKKPVAPIDFIDLGSGQDFERVRQMAQRKRGGSVRKLIAIDRESPIRTIPSNAKYAEIEAIDYLKNLPEHSVKVLNADNFFGDPSRFPHSSGSKNMCNALIESPIDEKLLAEIKRVLVSNGRLFGETTKWHCEALLEKLKKEGFEVRMRPLTEKEARNGTGTSRIFYQHWLNGEYYAFFGKDGWQLYRFSAINRVAKEKSSKK